MKTQTARNIVQAILHKCGGSTSQEYVLMVDKVLQDFVDTRTPGDIQWALHATHLYGGGDSVGLYYYNLKDWIKRINEILLSDIREFGPRGESSHWLEGECKSRVVGYFLQHAPWDSKPEEYGIDIESFKDDRKNLPKLAEYPFPSKEEWEERQWRI
jgi:hypothetical protein